MGPSFIYVILYLKGKIVTMKTPGRLGTISNCDSILEAATGQTFLPILLLLLLSQARTAHLPCSLHEDTCTSTLRKIAID